MKTLETKFIEYALLDFFHLKRSIRCALEVDVGTGIADFMAISKDDIVTIVEIKVTFTDFKSKHGHNFVGDKNYYAVPEELIDRIKPLVPKDIGIIRVKRNPYSGKPDVYIVKSARKLKREDSSHPLSFYKQHMWCASTSNYLNLFHKVLKQEGILKS